MHDDAWSVFFGGPAGFWPGRVRILACSAPVASVLSWRLPLLGGLVIGGFVSAILGGGWDPTWDLEVFDDEIGWNASGKVAWMFVGGVLIGFGTRLGGGCTSGHGIFGLSNLELPSIVTTIFFMTGGIVTTNLIYRVIV